MDYTNEEIELMRNNIKNQLWFDFQKETNLSELNFQSNINMRLKVQKVNAREIVHYSDFKKYVTDKFAAYFESGADMAISSYDFNPNELTNEEVVKLDYVMSMFPYQIVDGSEIVTISKIMNIVLNEIRTRKGVSR